ncbi:MAG: DUF1501 domain-containing protein [Armatimonadota bacterium]
MSKRCCGPNGPDTAPTSRREFLSRSGFGFGTLALASLLADQGLLAAEAPAANPLAPKQPHFAAKAKRIIFLFMSGGPSHLETFDPKPELQRLHGQKLPESFGPVKTRRGVDKNVLLGTQRTFRKHGQSGTEVSDFLPHMAGIVDDLAVLRGCYGDSVTHPESVYLMNCGSVRMGRPCLGSWVAYGLGSENQNMPAYVVMPDPAGWVKGGAPSWGNGFLPAAYQGTIMRGGKSPILNLELPEGVTEAQQRKTLDLVRSLNQEHLKQRREDSALAARIAAYELAYRMQSHAPQVTDLSKESEATKKMYGLDRPECAEFGLRCLLARRMVEHGVRCVQLYCGDTNGWDAHSDIEENHRVHCARTDQPAAALIKDLKQRGLLDSTLVVWAGEFGRTPMTEGKTGRDHNPYGFSIWMAGGGIKGGVTYGGTDPVGLRAVENRTHVHDIHATILHLLGLDHKQLTYLHNGRAERLTDVAGEVVRPILA